MTPPVLPGFDYRRVDVAGVTINCAVAGSGPPLLLHGYPQNHLAWRRNPGITCVCRGPKSGAQVSGLRQLGCAVLDERDLRQHGFADSAGFPSAHVHGCPASNAPDAVDLPDCRAGLATPVIVTMLSRRSWK